MPLRPSTRLGFLLIALGIAPGPAAAQWSRVEEVPIARIFSVWSSGDTIVAGADTCVDLSTDGGKTWRLSTRPAAGVSSVQAVRVRRGRLYAGTYGQGMFISDDLGAHWQDFNQGLFGNQRFVVDLVVKGDSLYAATAGAGAVVRNLRGAGSWQSFGDVFEPNQDPNLNSIGSDGSRLVVAAGSNGRVYYRDPGDPDWTQSDLDNVGIHAGLQAGQVAWTGAGWLVGTSRGVFHSVAGQEPWTLIDLRLGPILWTAFARFGHRQVAAFTRASPLSATIAESIDDGLTWTFDETLPGALVHQLAFSGGLLYAGREDGLWRREPLADVAAPAPRAALSLAIASAQPAGDGARLRFTLPEPARVVLEVFDVSGRRVVAPIREQHAAGPGELSLDLRPLPAGVYTARLGAGGVSARVRVVHVQ